VSQRTLSTGGSFVRHSHHPGGGADSAVSGGRSGVDIFIVGVFTIFTAGVFTIFTGCDLIF